MTHLSADELRTWYEHGRAAERGKVIGHLAECEACRRSLSALAMAADPEIISPPIVTTQEAVPLGYAVRKDPPSARSWAAWFRPAYGLAAAAVLVLSIVWLTTPRGDDGDTAVRSAELLALSPAGSTNVVEFKWESPLMAAKYRVVLRDAGGSLVYSGETAASPLIVAAAVRSQWATMADYTWTVRALDAAGEMIAESKPQAFRYQP